MAYVESIQKVSITIASGATTGTATITSVDTDYSFIVWGGFRTTETGQNTGATMSSVEITNGTTITATRGVSKTTTVTLECYVVESSTDLIDSVQAVTIAIAPTTTTNTATITSVATANSIASYLGNITDRASGGFLSTDSSYVGLTNSTTVTANRQEASSSTTNTLYAQIIEFNPDVIEGVSEELVSLTGTGTTGVKHTRSRTVSTLANEALFWQGMGTNNQFYYNCAAMVRAFSTTELTVDRLTSGNIIRKYALASVEFVSGVLDATRKGNFTLTSGATGNTTITAVDLDYAVVTQTGMAQNANAVVNFDDLCTSSTLSSTTNVLSTREATTVEVYSGYEVWEFSDGPTASGSVASSTGTSVALATSNVLKQAVASSTGTSTSTSVGSSQFKAVASSTGTSEALAVGLSAILAVGSASGTSSTLGVGESSFSAVANSEGDSTTAATGSSEFAALASSTGTSTSAAIGSSKFAALASSTGESSAAATGDSTTAGTEAVASSVGTSEALAVGASAFKAVAVTSGTSTVTGVSFVSGSVASAAGSSTTLGVGGADFHAVAASNGTSTTSAIGVSKFLGVASSSGLSTSSGVGTAAIKSVGASTGASAVSGIGSSKFAATAAAVGLSTVAAVGRSKFKSLASSTGLSTVIGISDSTGIITLDTLDLQLQITLLNNSLNISIVKELELIVSTK